MRSRTIFYAALMAAVTALMIYQLAIRANLPLSIQHVRAPLFATTVDGDVRNGYTLRLSNKWREARTFALATHGVKYIAVNSDAAKQLPDERLGVTVNPDATKEIPYYVTAPAEPSAGQSRTIEIEATDLTSGETVHATDHSFMP